MNSKKIILLGCVAACVFAASTATAQMRGHGGSMPRMGMRGAPMSHSMGRMPMHRGPMMNSPSGFRRFGIGDFGFPWWWGWGWGPSWGWGSGYPYGYYGGYNYGGYGSGYGYSDSSGSRVAELQSRLARAGYYHGAIDGIMGPATRRAIRAYERHSG